MDFVKDHRWRRMVWLGYILALCVASLVPQEMVQAPGGDKLQHFMAYALLVLIWPAGQTLPRMVLKAAALGVVLEIAQGVLPTGRYMDPADALANTCGACLGALILLALRRFCTSSSVRSGRP